MLGKLKEKVRGEDGFTLLEMILSVAILSVLTGIITVGIMGYLTTAYMSRVNETAKTVFLAAQNHLTQEKQMGRLSKFNENAKNFGGEVTPELLKEIFLAEDSSFDFAQYEKDYGTGNIRYVLLKEGAGMTKTDNPIYSIVNEYIHDSDLLEHTFLIEYDSKSGVVRSVFYTEKAATFSYTGNQKDKSNVILRDAASRKQKRQGYYGVDSTSLAKYNLNLLSPKNNKLVNDERLYAQWTESNYRSPAEILSGVTANANEAFDNEELRKYLVYDLEVYRLKDSGDERLFTIKNISQSDSKGSTLAQAEERAAANGLVIAYQEDTNTYQLMLDCLHNSIFDMFQTANSSSRLVIEKEVLASDMLYCKVSVRLLENGIYQGESVPVSTNQQSANYAGGAKSFSPTGLPADETEVFGNGFLNENGSSSMDGMAFSVSNARHLNNMRYSENVNCFVQRADIDWAKPESDRAISSELFLPLTFAVGDSGAADAAAYKGVFRVAKEGVNTYKIENLKINCLSGTPQKDVGMFRMNRGTIDGLQLVDAKVQGAYQTGAVAGSNAGIIQNVKLDNCTVEGSFYTGGVTGKNLAAGTLEQIECDTKVTGLAAKSITDKIKLPEGETVTYGQYIGGIAGLNQGNALALKTSLLDASGKALRSSKTVSGVSAVGGIFGGNSAKADKSVKDCINFNILYIATDATDTMKIQDFGGISGFNDTGSKIESCENRSLVFLEKNNAKPERIQNIGGIAGRNKGTLTACANLLADETSLIQMTKDTVASVKAGKIPVYSGINMGGLVGLNETDGSLKDCRANNVMAGLKSVGGLIGENQGTLTGGNNTSSGGLVIASLDTAGGIVGNSSQPDITGCTNYANVFAKSVAGGITGANGGSGDYTFTAQKGASEYYEELISDRYEHIDKNAKIINCKNYGFSYALDRYSGGIAGINYGIIQNSRSEVEPEKNVYLKGMLGKDKYKELARADCAGGIAGCNLGSISGGNAQQLAEISHLYGDSFVGGVVGLNKGNVDKYPRVEGDVYGSGSSIGGFIGLNLDQNSVTQLAFNDGMNIYGSYFVGGIIGCNVSDGTSGAQINGATTQATNRKGSITGTAYVGGIIGYQTKNTKDFTQLFTQDLNPRIKKAFEPYTPQSGNAQEGAETVFINCSNRSLVTADRYAGGIIGYNYEDSILFVSKSINYGSIKILDANKKVPDGFYFIGGITGRNSAGGVIDQCINDGSVESPSKYLGGICEVNEGYIQYCTVGKSQDFSSETGISGSHSVGGLVGLNSKNVVQCSTSLYARISGGDNTGGIVGTNDSTGLITGNASYAKSLSGQENQAITSSENLCISSGSVKGKDNTGGIVGLNEGQVENVSVENATVSGNVFVGGFIGKNTGLLATSENPNNTNKIAGLKNNAKKVTGVNQVGGIVGKHNATVIDNCTNLGIVEATGTTGYAGGITGSVEAAITISNCSNYGTVTSNKSQAGGIAGNNSGIIKDCSNFGSVTGSLTADENSAVGGITGINETSGRVEECISQKNTNSSSSNAIQGVFNVGGLIGVNRGTLMNQNKGLLVDIDIKIAESKLDKPGNIGGVIGQSYSGCTDTLTDYLYSGTINVPANGSQSQYIGGITGVLQAGMTLDNCIFAGQITGFGNDGNSGVGGLTGYSSGTIVVDKNKDGIYTSSTSDALVEGLTNVGGVAGVTFNTHRILLKLPSGETKELDQISQNQDQEVANDIYYVNLSSVSGLLRAGGFYGMISENKKMGITLKYYQNGLAKDEVAGTITINPVVGRTAEAIGGIIGTTYNGSTGRITLANVRNYGNIGKTGEYRGNARAIGGIVGSAVNSGGTTLTDAYNHGKILCGSQEIGGIAGRSEKSIIFECYNAGEIKTQSNTTGGIVGTAKDTEISAQKAKTALNKGNITITGKFSNCGGIAGELSGTCSISKVDNNGSITIDTTTRGDANTGGIVGRIGGNAQLNQCRNLGDIKADEVYITGGIAGSVNGSTVGITKCENRGQVYSDMQDVGGIIGCVTGTPTFTLTESHNYGTISIKYRGGGIVGRIQSSGGAAWNLKDCTNFGDIIGTLPKKDSNGLISLIGGCVGTNQSGASFYNFNNKGTLRIDQDITKSKITSFSQIGGIFGYFRNNPGTQQVTAAYQCKNEGKIQFVNLNTSVKINEIGGIAGNIQYYVLLEGCENYAEIDLDYLASSQQSNIGGIAGIAYENTKVLYCLNYSSVLGNVTMGRSIGGIVGQAKGLVYSSTTRLQKDKEGRVQGFSQIGGIVGYAYGPDCKIASIANKENTGFEISSNSFEVAGVECVGGVAGKQQAATIFTVMNRAEAEITLLASTGHMTNYSAGGITGLASFDENVPGVIANCYSFGKVRFAKNGRTYFLGGLVGNRAWKTDSGGKTTAVAIKDSFYLYDEEKHELVDASKPNTSIDTAVLAVGNEPNSQYGLDLEDQQYGLPTASELNTEMRFRWSQEVYEKMYCMVHGLTEGTPVPDTKSWDNLDTVLKNIVPYYDKYKLPIPQTSSVVSNDGYIYMLPIDKMPGFCERLEVRLYPEEITDEEIKNGNPEPGALLSLSSEVLMDNQLKSISFDVSSIANYQQYVGKTIKVAVKAYGVGQTLNPGGEIIYTSDSDRVVVQEFIVMPVLPTPQIEVVQQEGAALLYRITNWETYQKAAGELYDSIKNDPVLNTLEVYQKFLTGMENFTIRDYYLTRSGEARNENFVDVWTVKKEDIDENGQFRLNYSTSTVFAAQKSNRQYHDWDVKAVAANSDATLDAATVKAQNLYRYVTSYPGSLKYRIEASTKLAAPTNLQSRYTGGMDWEKEVGTPGYEISFQESVSPKEAIAGYLITVTNPANGKTHVFTYVPPTEEEPGGEVVLPSYQLTKDILLGDGENQLGLDLTSGSQPVQLSWSVSTQPNDSEAAQFFTASDNADSTILVLKKQYPVEPDISVSIKNDNAPNELTFSWTDNHSTGRDIYLVSYQVRNGDSIIQNVEPFTQTERECKVVLPDDKDGYIVDFNVVRQGIIEGSGEIAKVISLNSDRVSITKYLGEKLDSVTNVNAAFVKADGESLFYNVTFQIPDTLNQDKCKGFWIQAVEIGGGNAELMAEAIEVPFDVSQPVMLEIPVTHAGKQFAVHIISKPKDAIMADSERAMSQTVSIPSQKVAPPDELKVQLKKAEELMPEDLTQTGNALELEILKQMGYLLSWNVPNPSNVKNQQLEILLDGEVLFSQVTDGTSIKTEIPEDWSKYAGKKLLLRIYNLPLDANISLPSEAAELEFYIPRIKLVAPTFSDKPEDKKVVALRPDKSEIGAEDTVAEADYQAVTYTINWLESKLQEGRTGTKISVTTTKQDAEGNDVVDEKGKKVVVPVPFDVVTDEAGSLVNAPDGTYILAYTQNPDDYNPDGTPKDPKRVFTLTGIDKMYEQKVLNVEICYTTDVPDGNLENPGTIASEVYQESAAAQTEFMMPKLEITIVTKRNTGLFGKMLGIATGMMFH